MRFDRCLDSLLGVQSRVYRFFLDYLDNLKSYPLEIDRDVAKLHERITDRSLTRVTKDGEVSEYTLSTIVSPVLIPWHKAKSPEKALQQAKLHKLYVRHALENVPSVSEAK